MLSFRYQSLQHNDSVRLLALHPSLHDSDPIRCTIQHARLSDTFLKFEAVSYTWGNAAQTQVIYFHNGTRELHVGHNCYNALRQLRHKHEDRLLWIDAICINQNNLQERARQVRIMSEIYSRAAKVLVILGASNANYGPLFEELAAADEELLRTGDCDREPPSEAVLRLLEDLFQHSWFKRVWVLQEVCSKSSVQFFCGSASFSYTSLEKLYFGYRGTVVTRIYWPIALRWIGSQPEEFSSTQLNLWHLLGKTREYLATDPKDRVFALQSLTGPERSVMDLLIDYAQSTEECFTEVAKFLLLVPGAVRPGHTICIFSGASSACALRELPDGRWALISGDCHIFMENSEFLEYGYVFLCDEYIACNQDKNEEFILR
ncbi:HET-domain-containing protein [Lophiostoma macrostomum CBS 122681]|uniref:HET-domain-containing protein n=1 Tax=Lophiostoma macrostomum CBS 122681 TaxID=1314788 RepID=A0A6A6TAQ3_9PLEO|nr:HET-domain-containing protein [Lophiostoma macrostomum CBS 122681]